MFTHVSSLYDYFIVFQFEYSLSSYFGLIMNIAFGLPSYKYHVTLDGVPDYQCLSLVWSFPTKVIICQVGSRQLDPLVLIPGITAYLGVK